MTFSPQPPRSQPPPPPQPGTRQAVESSFASLTAPITLLALGLTGLFLGFAPALAFRGETASISIATAAMMLCVLVNQGDGEPRRAARRLAGPRRFRGPAGANATSAVSACRPATGCGVARAGLIRRSGSGARSTPDYASA